MSASASKSSSVALSALSQASYDAASGTALPSVSSSSTTCSNESRLLVEYVELTINEDASSMFEFEGLTAIDSPSALARKRP